MATIYTVEGNTSGGSTLVANGGGVAKKSYPSNYSRIACIWRPQYKSGEALKVVQESLKWVGYLEKKSNVKLESFTDNAGRNNYNIFAKHAATETGAKGIYVNGVAWCDMFVDDMLIRALGVQRTKELIYDWSAYTPTSSNYLKAAGAKKISNFADAQYGDIIFFKNSSGGICHVGIVITGAEDEIKAPKTETAAKTYNQKQFIKDVCKILKVKNAKQALNTSGQSIGSTRLFEAIRKTAKTYQTKWNNAESALGRAEMVLQELQRQQAEIAQDEFALYVYNDLGVSD